MSESTQIAAFNGKVTLKNREADGGKGNNLVTTDNLATPQLKLLQLISPEVKKHDAAYIEGAEAGMLFNTATRKLYDKGVFCLNLHFRPAFNIWNSDDELVGVFDSEEEASAYMVEQGLPPERNNIVNTPTHLLMLLDHEGKPTGAAMFYMSRSKKGASDIWNTLLKDQEKQGKARFSHIWRLDAVLVSNKKGQEYFNVMPKVICEAPDDLYDAAKAEFDAFFGAAKAA